MSFNHTQTQSIKQFGQHVFQLLSVLDAEGRVDSAPQKRSLGITFPAFTETNINA